MSCVFKTTEGKCTKNINFCIGEICPLYQPSNRDKLNAMSDEEFAEWLSCNCTGDGYGNSAKDWFDWLISQVEG